MSCILIFCLLVKKVERYYVHSLYNLKAKVDLGIPEFYDYDVALVQLKEDLSFTVDLKWGYLHYIVHLNFVNSLHL